MIACLLAVATAVSAATPSAAAVTAIPFRKSAAVSGSEVFGVLMTTLLVLAVFSALAWYARKRGWFDRWVGRMPSSAEVKRNLAVAEVLRVSRKTTVYRIRDGEREFLLAESSGPVQLSIHGMDLEPKA